MGDKVPAEDKKRIEEAIEKCRRIKDTSNDINEIKSAIEELAQASHRIAEELYKKAKTTQPGSETSSEAKKEEEVIEAEVEDKEDK
jgi:molecular chaperone DnaK